MEFGLNDLDGETSHFCRDQPSVHGEQCFMMGGSSGLNLDGVAQHPDFSQGRISSATVWQEGLEKLSDLVLGESEAGEADPVAVTAELFLVVLDLFSPMIRERLDHDRVLLVGGEVRDLVPQGLVLHLPIKEGGQVEVP